MRMKLFFFFCLGFIAIINIAASSAEIECIVDNEEWDNLEKKLSTCNIRQPITETTSKIASVNNETSVQALSINDNPQAQFIPDNLAEIFPELVAIRVQNCSVSSLGSHHFKGLNELIELSLPYNKIEAVSDGALKYNIKLQFLNLSTNKIKYVSDEILSQLRNLKQLFLDNNLIGFIDPLAFQNLINIEEVYLMHNRIAHLSPKTFESLVNLKELSVSHNQLESIDANLLSNCTKLEKVFFDNNKLKSIDTETFDGLKDLVFVYLKNNTCIDEFFDSNSLPAIKTSLAANCTSEIQLIKAEIKETNEKHSLETTKLSEKNESLKKTVEEEKLKCKSQKEMLQELKNALKKLVSGDID